MSAPTPTPGPAKARGGLLLLLVLLLGLLMGASGMVLLHHLGWGPPEPRPGTPGPGRLRHGGPPPERALRHLERALDLDEEQRAQVERILEERRMEIDALMRGTHEEIRSILSPEQQEKLDAMHERRGRRGGGRGSGRGGGPPPPPPT